MDLGLWDIILDIINHLGNHRLFAYWIFSQDELQCFYFLRSWDFCTYREVLFG